MPKRKRGSYSGGGTPRKSPRKGATTPGEVEEEKEKLPDVTFQFENEEGDKVDLEVNPRDVIVCVEREESANENQVPCKVKAEPDCVTRCVQMSTPIKRASPLSPTLLDNVQLRKKSGTPTPAQDSVEEMAVDETDPKIETDVPSVIPDEEERLKTRVPNGVSHEDSDVESKEPDKIEEEVEMKEEPAKITSQPNLTLIEPAAGGVVDLPKAVYRIIENYNVPDIHFMDGDNYLKWIPQSKEELCMEVLYELDEQDLAWLNLINKQRKNFHGLNLGPVDPEELELVVDRLEKEHFYETKINGTDQAAQFDEEAVCCICLEGDSDNSNQIIFCDMCNIPVHQECFGVPFIPEGSWLCRRCTICPNTDIQCIFCPNKDGAFKQTVDGRWSHVVCALWIPEVRFANTSLIEPVDDIGDIPPARWKLVCFLCKQRGVGACIQCSIRTCVTAFHLTCAHNAGLNLKIDTKETSLGVISNVFMKPFCDKHTPENVREQLLEKIATVKKVLNEKKIDPANQFPTLDKSRIDIISKLLAMPGKNLFLKKVVAYWKLKRKDRGGAPLLRNLEASYIPNEEPLNPPAMERHHEDKVLNRLVYDQMAASRRDLVILKEYFSSLKTLSEAQREYHSVKWQILRIKMESVNPLYLDVIKQLSEKDKKEIFKDPVTEDVAPDYFTYVKTPMDLSTMKKKAMELEYSSLEDLETDFTLMIENCKAYNKKSTVYYQSAIKMKKDGENIFDEARNAQQREIERQERLESERISGLEKLRELLTSIVDKIQVHDKYEIFKEPVDPVEVPDYLEMIKNPMDFSTMRKKIEDGEYSCVDDLQSDYKLMIDNCYAFNEDTSQYFKIARKMQGIGEKIFKEMRPNTDS